MNTCWKCGAETNNQTECDLCSQKFGLPENPNVGTVDWQKIKTFEELRFVLSVMFKFTCDKDTKTYQQLKKFMQDNPND